MFFQAAYVAEDASADAAADINIRYWAMLRWLWTDVDAVLSPSWCRPILRLELGLGWGKGKKERRGRRKIEQPQLLLYALWYISQFYLCVWFTNVCIACEAVFNLIFRAYGNIMVHTNTWIPLFRTKWVYNLLAFWSRQ